MQAKVSFVTGSQLTLWHAAAATSDGASVPVERTAFWEASCRRR